MRTELFPITAVGWKENDGRCRYAIFCAIGLPRRRKGRGTIEPQYLWWTGRKWSTEKSKRKIVNNFESATEIAESLQRTMQIAKLEFL